MITKVLESTNQYAHDLNMDCGVVPGLYGLESALHTFLNRCIYVYIYITDYTHTCIYV